mmetsp:Transcript_10977/g.13868  ORF Transcript_10977/g.13868 Transcript_10977/m.13868 type:complete len:87 (+) Transcript_10977:878-1138(+)
MDQYTNPKQGLIVGYRLVLGWNVFTLLFLFAATYTSYRQYKAKYTNKVDNGSVELEDVALQSNDAENLRPRVRSKQEVYRHLGIIT